MDFCYSLLLFATPFYKWGFWTWLLVTTTPLYIPNSMCVRWILVCPVQLVSKQRRSMSNTCPVVGYVLLRSKNQPRLLAARLKNQPLVCWLLYFPIYSIYRLILENPWFSSIESIPNNSLICKNCAFTWETKYAKFLLRIRHQNTHKTSQWTYVLRSLFFFSAIL